MIRRRRAGQRDLVRKARAADAQGVQIWVALPREDAV
jgi:hypothetical protein